MQRVQILCQSILREKKKCPYMPVRGVEWTPQQAISHTLDQVWKIQYKVWAPGGINRMFRLALHVACFALNPQYFPHSSIPRRPITSYKIHKKTTVLGQDCCFYHDWCQQVSFNISMCGERANDLAPFADKGHKQYHHAMV